MTGRPAKTYLGRRRRGLGHTAESLAAILQAAGLRTDAWRLRRIELGRVMPTDREEVALHVLLQSEHGRERK